MGCSACESTLSLVFEKVGMRLFCELFWEKKYELKWNRDQNHYRLKGRMNYVYCITYNLAKSL